VKLFNNVGNTNKFWTSIILYFFSLAYSNVVCVGHFGSHILGCSYIRLTITLCKLFLWLIFQRGLYTEINIKHAKDTYAYTKHTSLTWHHIISTMQSIKRMYMTSPFSQIRVFVVYTEAVTLSFKKKNCTLKPIFESFKASNCYCRV